jgi:LmbE family N-acetylglucosaminyl deacetylase
MKTDGSQGVSGATVLAVFAHPDDESLACGGTLARLAHEGAHVVIMCASRGERGSAQGPPVRDDQLGAARSLELRDAAAALGVPELIVLDYPDGDLRWAGVTGLHADIVMTIRRHRPAAVITFGEDGLYWHADHIAVHERTTTAVRSLGDDAPALYYVTMPTGTMRAIVNAAAAKGWTAPPKGFWSLVPDAFGLLADPPTFAVDVGEWVEQKLEAIRCHRSQMGSGNPFAQLDEQQTKRLLGTEQFQRAPACGHGHVLEVLGRPARPVESSR